ncbi:MAG: SAM-dependent chlorinase/fluorinase [Anaerolineae bacterium]|nr:SAM-dependent chlorinase/fluorinase [Anaerolineae bacterium]MDW8102929.1 SAM-dependent chlorinase/fluorinase [Anaerolineae bacterium]
MVITLLTDFGLSDNFVGVMKGVILSINPTVTIVDITHEVPPQDILTAAFLLDASWPYFPPGSIHVAVVDPGVGTARRAIAVETTRAIFLAPDNGLLTPILKRGQVRRVISLNNPRYWLPQVSYTFHGRDIFAPTAAHISLGVPLEEIGIAIEDPILMDWPCPSKLPDGTIVGHILHIDRFGNLITNLKAEDLKEGVVIRVADYQIQGLKKTFADVAIGEPVAYIGSTGYLEIAIRQGNAARTFNLRRGDKIYVEGQGNG